jgi:hypothetical protein
MKPPHMKPLRVTYDDYVQELYKLPGKGGWYCGDSKLMIRDYRPAARSTLGVGHAGAMEKEARGKIG